MTPAERVVRLKQLHDQVKALNEEIAQLEAEDEQYVAFRQRSQQAGRKLLAYLDYVRYSAFREQLEAAWTAAGRPRGWDKAPLLLKLREVLLVVGASILQLDSGLPVTELRNSIVACLRGDSIYTDETVPVINRRGRNVTCRIVCTPLSEPVAEVPHGGLGR